MTDDEYDELFRAMYPRLVAMGLAMSVERHVAQDLAQETLLRAYRHRAELHRYDSPAAWCRRVMGNLLIDRHRTSTAERTALERVQARGPATSAGVDAGDPAETVSATRWHDLVGSLTPQQRLIATLHYAEDLSVDTVAQTLELSAGTVKSALSKARNNLRRSLGARTDAGRKEAQS